MDIEKKLAAGQSKTQTLAIIDFIGDDKQKFKVLMTLFLKGDTTLAQRAGWPLSYIAVDHPALMTPYFDTVIKKLLQPGNHPAIARNILRMFESLSVPEKYHGTLLDACFAFIINASQPPAIRAFAITAACKICLPHAELRNELLLVLNDLGQYPQPAAIRSRIKSALKNLQQR